MQITTNDLLDLIRSGCGPAHDLSRSVGARDAVFGAIVFKRQPWRQPSKVGSRVMAVPPLSERLGFGRHGRQDDFILGLVARVCTVPPCLVSGSHSKQHAHLSRADGCRLGHCVCDTRKSNPANIPAMKRRDFRNRHHATRSGELHSNFGNFLCVSTRCCGMLAHALPPRPQSDCVADTCGVWMHTGSPSPWHGIVQMRKAIPSWGEMAGEPMSRSDVRRCSTQLTSGHLNTQDTC